MKAAAQIHRQIIQPWLAPSGATASACLQVLKRQPHTCSLPHGNAAQQAAWVTQPCSSSRGLWTTCTHDAVVRLGGSSRRSLAPAAAAAASSQQGWLQAPAAAAAAAASWGWLPSSSHRHLLVPQARCSISTSAAAAAAGDNQNTSISKKRKNRGAVMSPEQQRKVAEMDFKNTTLGFIFDQYTHPVSFWESGAYKDFSKTWAHIKKGIATWFNVRQAQSALKTNIPGGTGDRTALAEELAEIYLRVHKAQAQMQPDLARDDVSKEVFITLRAQTQQRRKQGWTRIDWQVLDEDKLSKNIKEVRARMVKLVDKSPFDWLQFTYCITSKQRFAAYKKEAGREKLVAGNPDEVLDVTEYVVFERKTRARVRVGTAGVQIGQAEAVEGSRWRLVAWLHP